MMKAARERHPAMVCEYQMDGFLAGQNGTARNLHTVEMAMIGRTSNPNLRHLVL